jgi:hypothetical protein
VAELADRERTEQQIERLREIEGRLDRKVASLKSDVATLTDRVDEVRMQVAQGFATLAIEGRLQQITDIVGMLQSNAYGERGSIWSAGNLLLAGNQLFWTLLDPVLRKSGMLTKSGSGALTLLTPVGSFITGELLLANRQQERFISGVARIDSSRQARETLRSRIAEGEWNRFQQRTDVPVTLYVLDGPGYARGVVRDGVLQIELFPKKGSIDGVRVAWMIDTGIGNG